MMQNATTPTNAEGHGPTIDWEEVWSRCYSAFPAGEPVEVRDARRDARRLRSETGLRLGHALDEVARRRHRPDWSSWLRTQMRIAHVPRDVRLGFARRAEDLVATLRALAEGPMRRSGASLTWTRAGPRLDGVTDEGLATSLLATVEGREAGAAVRAVLSSGPLCDEHANGDVHHVAATAGDAEGSDATASLVVRQKPGLRWTSRWIGRREVAAARAADAFLPVWLVEAGQGVVHAMGAPDGRPEGATSPTPTDLHRAIVDGRHWTMVRGLCFDPLDWGFALEEAIDARATRMWGAPVGVVPTYRPA